ncbi:hypothetical protein EJ05DRAFT_99092 [Pseudovirgaria hyperparasitica]|uniref:Uncharacterized protein n=1 Tax=Pseudovirgaria hyperparasitica TaxID=470096 RepID=A0A6A6VXL4_9PEZI|nr:uncharacterized protein EJ05DRAFT_99092 [Pseudovirgaria hyperparasitica]KAF2755352.1 hypothetical protein EJ05DRAFT_99092 [Pseudovirgaria hyperparasitica]
MHAEGRIRSFTTASSLAFLRITTTSQRTTSMRSFETSWVSDVFTYVRDLLRYRSTMVCSPRSIFWAILWMASMF